MSKIKERLDNILELRKTFEVIDQYLILRHSEDALTVEGLIIELTRLFELVVNHLGVEDSYAEDLRLRIKDLTEGVV